MRRKAEIVTAVEVRSFYGFEPHEALVRIRTMPPLCLWQHMCDVGLSRETPLWEGRPKPRGIAQSLPIMFLNGLLGVTSRSMPAGSPRLVARPPSPGATLNS